MLILPLRVVTLSIPALVIVVALLLPRIEVLADLAYAAHQFVQFSAVQPDPFALGACIYGNAFFFHFTHSHIVAYRTVHRAWPPLFRIRFPGMLHIEASLFIIPGGCADF
ncbi:hypothetical protein D3C76_1498070 [compost metagenome]